MIITIKKKKVNVTPYHYSLNDKGSVCIFCDAHNAPCGYSILLTPDEIIEVLKLFPGGSK